MIIVDRAKWIKNFDWTLLALVGSICAVGLVLLYSAGYSQSLDGSPTMNRQFMSMVIGFTAFIIGCAFSPSWWNRWSVPIYLLGCALLALVYAEGVVAGGSRRWLEFGGFRFQPSEFTKLALILALAKVFSSPTKPVEGYSFKTLIYPLGVMAGPAVLILFEPDLGTALCHFLIGGSMLLVAGVRTKTLVISAFIGLMLLYPAWSFLEPYQQKRVVSFLSPEKDPLGSGYHAIQSKIAVGSGSVTGKGFLEGSQTQLRFLPEQTTDFVFSVLAEEWGFVGSVLVLGIYGFTLIYCLAIAAKCRDQFSTFVVVGVVMLLFWQILVNIGMVTAVLPVVGLTLPLISYGGSSAITILAAFGLVAGISMRRFLF